MPKPERKVSQATQNRIIGALQSRLNRGKSKAKRGSIAQMPWQLTPWSSWVHSFRYFAPDLLLEVRFKRHPTKKDRSQRIVARCRYTNIAPNLAANLRRVRSPGKFVHRWLFNLSYTMF